jgi:WD40 repeat protein
VSRLDKLHRFALFKAWDERCAWCEEPMAFNQMEVEHIIPKSLVGTELANALNIHGLADDYDLDALMNLVPSCRRCNRDKGRRLAPKVPSVTLLLDEARTRARTVALLAGRLSRNSKLRDAAAVVLAHAEAVPDPAAAADDTAVTAAAAILDAEIQEFTGKPVPLPDRSSASRPWVQGGRSVLSLPVPRRKLLGSGSPAVNAIALGSSGGRLATAGADKTARVWDLGSEQQLVELRHDASVTAVGWTLDERRLVTVAGDRAHVWLIESGKLLSSFKVDRGRHAAVSRDGAQVAVAKVRPFAASSIGVWKTSDAGKIHDLEHRGEVEQLVFEEGGQHLASANDDHTAHVWDLANGHQVVRLDHPSREPKIVFDGRGRPREEPYRDRVRAVAFSPDARCLVTGSTDATARVWELSSGTCTVELTHLGSVLAVAFSPDGSMIATASSKHLAHVWDPDLDRPLAQLHHESWVVEVAFSPVGRQLVTAEFDGAVRVWEPKST